MELVQAAEKLFKKFRESIWEGMSSKFPVFAAASSALVERIFSVIKAATTPQQNNESPETFEARVLALANGNKKEKKKKVVI